MRVGEQVGLHYGGVHREARVVAIYPDRGQASVVMACDGKRLAVPLTALTAWGYDCPDNSIPRMEN